MIDFRTLTVTDVKESLDLNTRVTISPGEIRLVLVHHEIPVSRQGQEYKRVDIVFADGFSYEVHLSDFDINVLETTVGAFGIPIEE